MLMVGRVPRFDAELAHQVSRFNGSEFNEWSAISFDQLTSSRAFELKHGPVAGVVDWGHPVDSLHVSAGVADCFAAHSRVLCKLWSPSKVLFNSAFNLRAPGNLFPFAAVQLKRLRDHYGVMSSRG